MSSSERSYVLTDSELDADGTSVYRVKAVRDIPRHGVKVGDIGGYVEGYHSLQDNAWVAGDAVVMNGGRVVENAFVCGDALVDSGSTVSGNAILMGHAALCEGSLLTGNAVMGDHAEAWEGSVITGSAVLARSAYVRGETVTEGVRDTFAEQPLVHTRWSRWT